MFGWSRFPKQIHWPECKGSKFTLIQIFSPANSTSHYKVQRFQKTSAYSTPSFRTTGVKKSHEFTKKKNILKISQLKPRILTSLYWDWALFSRYNMLAVKLINAAVLSSGSRILTNTSHPLEDPKNMWCYLEDNRTRSVPFCIIEVSLIYLTIGKEEEVGLSCLTCPICQSATWSPPLQWREASPSSLSS